LNCKFLPDYKFRFCGKNGNIEEERFQYWNGTQWIGSAISNDPAIYAVVGDSLMMEFEYYNLDSLYISTPFPANRTRYRVNIAGEARQGDYWDKTRNAEGPIIGDYDVNTIEQINWKEIKGRAK
jgi:hypothetical protein